VTRLPALAALPAGDTFVELLLDDAGLTEDPEPFAEFGTLGGCKFVFVGGGSRLGRFGM
jgi:hypothetical protein